MAVEFLRVLRSKHAREQLGSVATRIMRNVDSGNFSLPKVYEVLSRVPPPTPTQYLPRVRRVWAPSGVEDALKEVHSRYPATRYEPMVVGSFEHTTAQRMARALQTRLRSKARQHARYRSRYASQAPQLGIRDEALTDLESSMGAALEDVKRHLPGAAVHSLEYLQSMETQALQAALQHHKGSAQGTSIAPPSN